MKDVNDFVTAKTRSYVTMTKPQSTGVTSPEVEELLEEYLVRSATREFREVRKETALGGYPQLRITYSLESQQHSVRADPFSGSSYPLYKGQIRLLLEYSAGPGGFSKSERITQSSNGVKSSEFTAADWANIMGKLKEELQTKVRQMIRE